MKAPFLTQETTLQTENRQRYFSRSMKYLDNCLVYIMLIHRARDASASQESVFEICERLDSGNRILDETLRYLETYIDDSIEPNFTPRSFQARMSTSITPSVLSLLEKQDKVFGVLDTLHEYERLPEEEYSSLYKTAHKAFGKLAKKIIKSKQSLMRAHSSGLSNGGDR